MRLGEANFDDFCQIGKSKSSKNQSKVKFEAKTGFQGDQAAPKAPKLKPKDAQSIPKVAQRHTKIPKVAKSPRSESKSGKNGSQNEPNIFKNHQKKHTKNLNDFGEDI